MNRYANTENVMKWSSLSRAIVAAFAALLMQPALASTQTGDLEVFVSGPDGMPVEGVALEVSGKNLLGARKASSDADGSARFRELPPGKYSVKATHDVYREVTTEDIGVDIGRTSTVDVLLEMPVAETAEAYVVKGKVPMVDTESTTMGQAISADFTETVPTSRTYQGVAQLTPGVVGGSNPNVHGGTQYGNQYLIDGINVTDPVTNTFSANFNFDAIQSVEVLTGGRDAEYGAAVGGIVNVVTKSGSNRHEVDLSLYHQPTALQAVEEGEDRVRNTVWDLNAGIGGPIIKDKLWYYGSFQLPYTAFSLPAIQSNLGIFPDLGDDPHPARTFFGFFGLGKLTWQPKANQTFRLLVQGDPADIRNTKQDATVHPDAERRQVQTGFIVSGQSEIFLGSKTFWNTKLAYSRNRLQITPVSGLRDISGHENTDTGTSTINDTLWLDDQRNRMQLHSSLAYTVDDLMGRHELKAGVDVSLTWNKVLDTIPGGGYFIDNGLDPTNPESISGAGLPYQWVQVVEDQDTTIFGDTQGLFVQDIWKPIPELTIRPGLRFDTARMRNYEGEAQVKINTFSPRIGVSWDPFGDRKTALRAGYYQYVDTGYLILSDFAGGRSKLTRTWQYNPVTGEYDLFVRESGGEGGVDGKQYLKDAWNQQRPRTHEFILGASRELADDLALSLDFIYRYHANQWEDDEINAIWNDTGDSVIGFRNGESRYIYSLGALEESFIRYYGVELAMNKRFSSNLELIASYTWSRTEGTQPGIITVAFDRPRQSEVEFGLLPFHREHVVKVYASYRLPWGITLGGRVLYASGAPYNRYYFNNFFSDYNDRRAPRGYDYNEDGELVPLRLPDTMTLNARVGWNLEKLTGQKLELYADVFNVLNSRTTTSVETRNLPDGGATEFGDEIDRLDPLNVQLGIRYRY